LPRSTGLGVPRPVAPTIGHATFDRHDWELHLRAVGGHFAELTGGAFQLGDFIAHIGRIPGAAGLERFGQNLFEAAQLFDPLAYLGQAILCQTYHFLARLVIMRQAQKLADIAKAKTRCLRRSDELEPTKRPLAIRPIVATGPGVGFQQTGSLIISKRRSRHSGTLGKLADGEDFHITDYTPLRATAHLSGHGER
jgi:hypothetical protein